MRKRIFRNMCLLSLATVLLSFALVFAVMYHEFNSRMQTELKMETEYLSAGIATGGEDYLYSIDADPYLSRVTVIAQDGTVQFDSEADQTQMENHLDRPEIQDALRFGKGQGTRLSNTIGKQTYYYALKLDDGRILRVANTTDSIYASMLHCLPWLIVVGVAAFLFAMLLARWQTKKIVVPMNKLDLEHPEDSDVYDELTPLLERISKQNRQIADQVQMLKEKQEELTAITENMQEGLVVLDEKLAILSINASARALFQVTDEECFGRHILTLNRSDTFQKVISRAKNGQAQEEILELDGKYYQLFANPASECGAVKGIVLLILDITERWQSEKMRQEFSANVSHELKTPLTSISGYAELMKNGLVRPEDIADFSGRIYKEASRLITLVEDIIELSRLDESDKELPCEQMDLTKLCKGVVSRLEDKAERNKITMKMSGVPAEIIAVPHLVEEMVYNLCDNAIKYNRSGGKVEISVTEMDTGVVLTVSDNGIGIPKEDHQRIFERFYRVDKSHSKETGGTGLGLSIVKHIAEQHHAKLQLQSETEKGTTIRVFFPKVIEV